MKCFIYHFIKRLNSLIYLHLGLIYYASATFGHFKIYLNFKLFEIFMGINYAGVISRKVKFEISRMPYTGH